MALGATPSTSKTEATEVMVEASSIRRWQLALSATSLEIIRMRQASPREVSLVLRPSKSAITLQSLNVNYRVLPRLWSAVRAL